MTDDDWLDDDWADDDSMFETGGWATNFSDNLQRALGVAVGAGADWPAAPHTLRWRDLADPPEQPVALTVRVDVDDTTPPVWRRLVLDGDLLLDEVHEILQVAFDRQGHHPHKFWPGPRRRIGTGPSFLTEDDLREGHEDGLRETDVQLDQLLQEPGDQLFYTYGFGADWTHAVRLESVAPLDPGTPRAVCAGGRMAAPLLDCNGAWAHNELVEAYRSGGGLAGLDEEEREWVGAGWDPTHLDREELDARLALAALTAEEMREAMSGTDQPGGLAPLPPAIEPMLGRAPAWVLAELAVLLRRARAGLLHEHEGRPVPTRQARSLTTEEEYVAAVAPGLLHHPHPDVQSARVLYALLTAADGRVDPSHVAEVARILTLCGVLGGPTGVEPRQVSCWVHPVWSALRQAAGEGATDESDEIQHHRAVALAWAALWPEERTAG